MAKYHTPGVYFEWEDSRLTGVSLARADIAGFVGIAMRGPVGLPVRVESWNQFTSVFGRHTVAGYLAWAVEGFFANGGRRCWVVRVASEAAKCAEWVFAGTDGEPALTLTAATPGSWAKELVISIVPLAPGLFTLTLRLPDGFRETWRNLEIQKPYVDLPGSAGTSATRVTLEDSAAWQSPPMLDVAAVGERAFHVRLGEDSRTVAFDSSTLPPHTDKMAANPPRFSVQSVAKKPNRDPGVAPAPLQPGFRHFTVRPRFAGKLLNDAATGSRLVRFSQADSVPDPRTAPAFRVGSDGLADLRKEDFRDALKNFARIDEIAVLAMPDIMAKPHRTYTRMPRNASCSVPASPWPDPPPLPEMPAAFDTEAIEFLQQAMVAQCALLKDRLAILDFPSASGTHDEAVAWRVKFKSDYAACYYPWLMVPDVLQLEGMLRAIPPSGHVAGIFARVEHLTGVHKAPANEVLEGVEDVTVGVDQIEQGLLNDEQVNVICPYHGRRVRVAGARTGSEDRALLFVNVRRLLIAVERSIRMQLQWIAFEPQNPALWRQVDRVVRSFLDSLWRRGMLDGASREEAYSVTCDATVNPESESAKGKLVCEIGILPPWPAEFVVMRIGITEGAVEMLAPAEAQVG